MVERGLNSDVVARGISFHIQTEDWGEDRPFIVTRVYCNGAVIASLKTPYSEALRHCNIFLLAKDKSLLSQAVQKSLRAQHDKTVQLVQSGALLRRPEV